VVVIQKKESIFPYFLSTLNKRILDLIIEKEKIETKEQWRNHQIKDLTRLYQINNSFHKAISGTKSPHRWN